MTRTAKMYGGSLYDLALSESLADKILKDLKMFLQVLKEEPGYIRLLNEPSVPKKERKALLDEAWKDTMHPYTLNFIKLLLDKGGLDEFAGCVEEYQARYNKDLNIVVVQAVSAAPLSEALRAKLVAKLEKMSGSRIDLKVTVDETLLGGMRLELEGREYDGTISGKLDEIHSLLKKA